MASLDKDPEPLAEDDNVVETVRDSTTVVVKDGVSVTIVAVSSAENVAPDGEVLPDRDEEGPETDDDAVKLSVTVPERESDPKGPPVNVFVRVAVSTDIVWSAVSDHDGEAVISEDGEPEAATERLTLTYGL